VSQSAHEEKNMPGLGAPELIIILLIVVVLFGGGRVARLGGELGSAVREFRRGITDSEAEKKKSEELPDQTTKTS
jgi:sec-independent protein translocase protein TatA